MKTPPSRWNATSGSERGMFPWAAAAVAALLWSLLPGPVAAATASSASTAATAANSCENARLKCAYRTGCGHALQNYLMRCSSTLQQQAAGGKAACPEHCQHALIALTSTDEGKDLMTCKCGDEYCEESKQRVEVCRPHVEQATLNSTIVSCRLAQWICKADALCSTALDYYHRFCRSMFQGKRCSRRCNNSISILQRQEKAAKLISCRCDSRDDSDCAQIRENMDRLCFPGESNGFGSGGEGRGSGGEGRSGGGGAGEGVGAGHANPPPSPEHHPPADAPAAAARAAPSLVLPAAAAALWLLLAARRLTLAT